MLAQGLVCGGVLTIKPALGLLFALLFWPVCVAFALDRSPGRPMARSVALCSAAAGVGPVHTAWTGGVWSSGPGLHAAWALLDPEVLGSVWCAAGAGWLLHELAPLAVQTVLGAWSAARAARLRAERDRLLAR